MAEQNNQAERAAPEFDAEEAGIEILRFLHQRKAPQAMIDKLITMSCAAGGYEVIRRRAALPAAVDAEGLPPLPTYYYDIDGALRLKGKEFEYGSVGEYVRLQDARAAIAADRRKQSTLQALYDAGQDTEASGKPQSIDTEEFRKLLSNYAVAISRIQAEEIRKAFAALIAYIDSRSAPAAGTVKDAERWRETLMHVGGTYTDVGAQRFTLRYLNPVDGADIMKGSVAGHFTAAIDAVIEAHNRAGKEQG